MRMTSGMTVGRTIVAAPIITPDVTERHSDGESRSSSTAGRSRPGNALGSGLVPAHQPSRPIGAHVRVTGGLAAGGLRYAAETGAEAIQVFASNPRGWALSAGDAREDAALRDHVVSTGLPVFVHAAYLVNLGSPDPATRRRSAASLAHSLRRGREIAARGVVVHTGSAVRASREQGMCHVRECSRCST